MLKRQPLLSLLAVLAFFLANGGAGTGCCSELDTSRCVGPTLYVSAAITPCLTIELSEQDIHFLADKGPGRYNADKMVDVRVATNYGAWTVCCTANPLLGPNGGTIGPERLFASNDAGATYQGLDVEKQVASGGPQAFTKVATLSFALQTEWADRPGRYQGTIAFTYLAKP